MASSQQHLGSRSSTLLNILRQFLVIVALVLPPVTCWAVTPKNVVVMAKSLDDLITLDPAEVFEFSGTEIVANLYDRLFLANPTNPGEMRRLSNLPDLLQKHARKILYVPDQDKSL